MDSNQIGKALLNLTEQVGNLNGSFDTHIENQKVINENLTKLVTENREEIKILNRVKNIVIGLGSIGLIGGAITAIKNFLHLGGHGS